jgi:hypothetical protein
MIECSNCHKRHRTITADQCADRSMSEKVLQDRVVGRAKRAGWKVAHAGRGWVGGTEEEGGQWVTPMSKGWPDLTLAKPGHTLLFMELKREEGIVEVEQIVWLALLNKTGNAAMVVRPRDLRDGSVATVLRLGNPLRG